ncbi:hypothetical protein RHMOL_Rhmol12G0078400 [Rhododendron molle]|uniref:Uncharacterized protein n=1 Tax=Rhododendron molle TaxID=49168 RepID=A0ACC0LGH7_RHOML|nr:hypothetical protein RHMOL_Rhmol12G0078400 [Rhododendron molle]
MMSRAGSQSTTPTTYGSETMGKGRRGEGEQCCSFDVAGERREVRDKARRSSSKRLGWVISTPPMKTLEALGAEEVVYLPTDKLAQRVVVPLLLPSSGAGSSLLSLVLGTGAMITTFLSSGLCIFLLVVLVRFLHKVWWTPIRIRHIMASQGIKGPAYRFLHGNTKEIIRMRGESISTPMDFSSHHIFARLLPDIHAWKQLYGIKLLALPFV